MDYDEDDLAGTASGFQHMLATPESRRAFWLLFQQSQIFSVSPSLEPTALAFTEGRRSWALQVWHQASNLQPELYELMRRENQTAPTKRTTEE